MCASNKGKAMTENQREVAARLLESVLQTVRADDGNDSQTSLHGALQADGIKASLTIRFENILH